MLRHHQRASRNALLAACLQDSVAFSKHFLRFPLWPAQQAIHRSIDTHVRTAVKASTTVGKTACIASYGLSWLARYPDGKVLITSSRWAQIERQFFGEVRTLVERARGRYEFPAPLLTSLKIGPNRYMVGLAPNSEEGMGGDHSGHVLEIIDEGSDVDDHVYDGAEGPLSGGHARLVVLGNPLQVGGRFHRIFTQERAVWNCLSICAWDTPNFAWLGGPEVPRADKRARLLATPDDEIRRHIVYPNLTSPLWVKDRAKVWSPTHPGWQARIEAEFPTIGSFALIPLAWAERARERAAVDDGMSPIEVGLDVAGGGRNATAGCARIGPNIIDQQTWHMSDPLGPVVTWLRGLGSRLAAVRIDTNGVGHNFLPRVADKGFPCESFVGSATAHNDEQFVNRNAEAYWGLRERYEAGEINGLKDERAFNQLTAMVYGYGSRSRISMKGKGGLTEKGEESPDESDCQMMAFAGVANTASYWSEPAGRDEDSGEPVF